MQQVTSDIRYTAIHLDGTEATIEQAVAALDEHGIAADLDRAKFRAYAHSLTGQWVLFGEDHTVRTVHPSDFAAHYTDVDEGILDALAADAAPPLPAGLLEGGFTTTVHWEFEAIDVADDGTPTGGTTWLPADDEDDARAQARNHLRVIRHWSEIVVTGQKTEVRL